RISLGFLLLGLVAFQFSFNAKLGGEGSMSIKALHSDCQKWRGFRYAIATPLLAAGELDR
ncbi:MAG: hypothetical protein KZQ98_16070, partial [Candidatus Thiodiazotropha sp. (ex Lucinoma borealis)]|nr:hypothetical protein [Candidatus Thiodiazotropha sp. (ex Lucinoma borealis)]